MTRSCSRAALCMTLAAVLSMSAARVALAVEERVWVSLDRLSDYPLPRPHLKIAAMLKGFSD